MSTTPPYHYSYQTIDDPEQMAPYKRLIKTAVRNFELEIIMSFIVLIGTSIIIITTDYIDASFMWFIIPSFGFGIATALDYLDRFSPALQATTM